MSSVCINLDFVQVTIHEKYAYLIIKEGVSVYSSIRVII